MIDGLLARWRRRALSKYIETAHALFDRGDFAGAAAAYAKALAIEPGAAVSVNLGYSRLSLGEFDAAESSFRRALALEPGFAAALVGLGDVAAQNGAHQQALAQYDLALAGDPSLAVAHNNRAQSLFALGRTGDAWRDAEWRYKAPGSQALYPHRYAIPLWQGAPLQGRLLVHWEQGYGDIIQHLRFLPLLRGRVDDFAFECPPPLLHLVARMLPSSRLIEAGTGPAASTGFAAYLPLLSLPHVLGITGDALPRPPYLHADPERSKQLRGRWEQPGVRLIGIAWRGSNFDASRNAALADFAQLAGPGSRLVSLQKDINAQEAALLADLGAIDASDELSDFAATADVIGALDAVVCVDTAVAHLSGAMAKSTCLLLNEPCAVRWMLERTDTPWYSGTRLLRKQASKPWSGLIAGAADD